MAQRSRIWRALQRVAVVTGTLFVGTIVAEGAVRWRGYAPLRTGIALLDAQLIEGDAELGYRYRPDRQLRNRRFRGAPEVTTDGAGLRAGPGWDPDGDGPVVLMVGDSTTFCGEVGDDHTASAELWRALGDGTRVMNAGVRGYGTLQSCLSMERHLAETPGIEVVLYLFTPNDLFDNLQSVHRLPRTAPTAWWNEGEGQLCVLPPPRPVVPPGETLEELEGVLEPPAILKLERLEALAGEAAALLEGPGGPRLAGTPFAAAMATLPAVMGPFIERNRDRARPAADPPLRQRLLATARRHSALVHLLWTRREGAFHYGEPARDAGSEYARSYGTHISMAAPLRWAEENGGEDVVVALLERMAAACDAQGARFVASAFLLEAGDPASARFAGLCRRAGVAFVPLDAEFGADPASFAARTSDGRINPHWNRRGTVAFARAMAPALADGLAPSGGPR